MNIISRAQWGAKPPKTPPVPLKLPVAELYLHHTVTAVTANRVADVRVVQDIAFSRTFNDISYNFLCDLDGTVYEGRGLNVGAHLEGRNSRSIGVALIGNYESRVVTDAQVDSVRELVAWLIGFKALNPGLYPTGGHRDAPNAHTACPGRFAMQRLAEMRAPWIGTPAPTPLPLTPVHDWEAPVKTTMLTIPLDDKGCGWADFDPVLGRDPIPVAVMKQGPSPPEDGYWPAYAAMDLSAQPRGGKLRVTARGGPPGGKAVAWVTVS